MNALAEALTLTIAHLSSVSRDDDDDADGDCRILESVTAILRDEATPDERIAIGIACDSAIASLTAHPSPNHAPIQG
jgi:hypothetical protein